MKLERLVDLCAEAIDAKGNAGVVTLVLPWAPCAKRSKGDPFPHIHIGNECGGLAGAVKCVVRGVNTVECEAVFHAATMLDWLADENFIKVVQDADTGVVSVILPDDVEDGT